MLKPRMAGSCKDNAISCISWRAVRFVQDVELLLTGKLIVEVSLGDQLQQSGPSAATLHGPAGLLEAR